MDMGQNTQPAAPPAPQKFCGPCKGSVPAAIDNSSETANTTPMNAYRQEKARSKQVALALCFFLGGLCVYKFHEGKVGMGLLYLFTTGLFGIRVLMDSLCLLFKPNPYCI